MAHVDFAAFKEGFDGVVIESEGRSKGIECSHIIARVQEQVAHGEEGEGIWSDFIGASIEAQGALSVSLFLGQPP